MEIELNNFYEPKFVLSESNIMDVETYDPMFLIE